MLANIGHCCYTAVILALFLATGSLLIICEKKISQEAYISSATLNEVANDWITQPYVDVTVIERGETVGAFSLHKCPDDYPEYVMERMFYGSSVACDCLGVEHRYIKGDNEMNLHEVCDRN